MNITGLSQYSKSVAGLRQPKTYFTGQDLNLMFIYPILIADKIPNGNIIEGHIRNFLSVTFLKEIFIQNAISVIGMANQIQPLENELDQQIDPTSIMARVFASSTGSNLQTVIPKSSNYNISSNYRDIIQHKIKEKTAIIEKYTKIDPVLSKFNPYVETITMGNLIDVPVFVGTKAFQVDTISLTHILIGSLALRKPLHNTENLESICNTLVNLDPKSYWRLLENLTISENPNNPVSGFIRKLLQAGARTIGRHSSDKIGSWLSNRLEPRTRQLPYPAAPNDEELRKQIRPKFDEKEVFYVLNTIKQNMDQTKLFFRFVLDQKLLNNQFGIKTFNEASLRSDSMKTILSPEIQNMRETTISNFFGLMSSSGSVIFNSTITPLSPYNSPSGRFDPLRGVSGQDNYEALDILDLMRDNSNELITSMRTSLDSILEIITKSIEENDTVDMLGRIERARIFCEFPADNELERFQTMINNSNLLPSFSIAQFNIFLDTLSHCGQSSLAQTEKMQQFIQNFVGTKNNYHNIILSHLINIRNKLANFVRSIIVPIENRYNNNINPPIIPIISHLAPGITVDKVTNDMAPMMVNYLSQYFYFLFFYALQSAFSKFLLVADFNLKKVSTEVTDPHNYSLILPLEIITMLHAALVTKNWNELTSNGNNRLTSNELSVNNVVLVNDNYIKNIIRMVSNKISIPNLFVIDSKKGDIYYKLMFQTSINKTKISTFETFVKSVINKPMQQTYF